MILICYILDDGWDLKLTFSAVRKESGEVRTYVSNVTNTITFEEM